MATNVTHYGPGVFSQDGGGGPLSTCVGKRGFTKVLDFREHASRGPFKEINPSDHIIPNAITKVLTGSQPSQIMQQRGNPTLLKLSLSLSENDLK